LGGRKGEPPIDDMIGPSGTILIGDSRMAYHTDLSLVFRGLGERQREYDWLITNLEVHHFPPDFPEPVHCVSGPTWFQVYRFTGDELSDFVNSHDIQFIWAVLSGFPRASVPDPATLHPYPYADGNAALWKPQVSIQHPSAEVEIVCFDGTATILLSRREDITNSFRGFFKEAVDLEQFNRSSQGSRAKGAPPNSG
jgi:hypothetical protein